MFSDAFRADTGVAKIMKSEDTSEYSQKRLNIVLPERTIERINDVKAATFASSATDVIKNAILSYEALVEYSEKGYKFYLKKDDDNNFSPLHFLFDVKSNSKKP